VKLNEFKVIKKVDEVNLSHVIGDYGAAGLKQMGNRLMGNAEGQLSVKDKMAKEKFIADFIGRANTNLSSAIQSGLVDPKIKAGATTPPTDPNAQTTTQPGPSNTTTTPPPPATPETPEQKRIRVQKLAQQKADKEGMPFSKLPGNQPQVQAGTIRQQKQGFAAQQAQDQMAPVSKLPADQFTKSASNVRQQQQGVATQNAQNQMSPVSKLPADQFAKSATNVRQQQQGIATQNAQATMTPKPVAPATETPAQKRIRLQQVAAQNAQASMKEGKFDKLNALFESIVEAGEQQSQSISDYLQNMVKQYMKGKLKDPQALAQLKKLADATQSSYPSVKQGLTNLANLAYATSYSQGTTAKTDATADTKPAGFFSGLAQGSGLTQANTTQPNSTPNTTARATEPQEVPDASTETPPATEPTQVKQDSPYRQAGALLGKLDKKGKQRILRYLDKQLGTPTTQPEPKDAETPSAFGNMARQLDTMGQSKSSTGGTTTPTGTGVRNTASPTNPNQAPALDKKISIAKNRTRKKSAKV
jgi:hypothetical protein